MSQMTHVHAITSNLTSQEGADLPTRPPKKNRSAVLKRDALRVRHIGSATGGPNTRMSSVTTPPSDQPHESCRRDAALERRGSRLQQGDAKVLGFEDEHKTKKRKRKRWSLSQHFLSKGFMLHEATTPNTTRTQSQRTQDHITRPPAGHNFGLMQMRCELRTVPGSTFSANSAACSRPAPLTCNNTRCRAARTDDVPRFVWWRLWFQMVDRLSVNRSNGAVVHKYLQPICPECACGDV